MSPLGWFLIGLAVGVIPEIVSRLPQALKWLARGVQEDPHDADAMLRRAVEGDQWTKDELDEARLQARSPEVNRLIPRPYQTLPWCNCPAGSNADLFHTPDCEWTKYVRKARGEEPEIERIRRLASAGRGGSSY